MIHHPSRHDIDRRLTSVDGVGYSWDDRLEMTTNGITTTHYTLDLAARLTQVLDDGAFTYLYGNGRIAQYDANGGQYFLGDALGSVRQVVDANGEVLLARSYEPFGEVLVSAGEGDSSYGYTGEWTSFFNELVYLRARWYSPSIGRFYSRDTWQGDYYQPMSYNAWLYVSANPVNRTDPTGMCEDSDGDGRCNSGWQCFRLKDPIAIKYCLSGKQCPQEPPSDISATQLIKYINTFGITLSGNWTGTYLDNLSEALFTHIRSKNIERWLNGKKVTLSLGGKATCMEDKNSCYYGETGTSSITFYATGTTNPIINMLHEFGHLSDNTWSDYFTNALEKVQFIDSEGNYIAGWDGKKYKSLIASEVRDFALKSPNFEGQDAWQQRGGTPHWEDWADIFSNYIIDNINQNDVLGRQLYDFAKRMDNYTKSYGIGNLR